VASPDRRVEAVWVRDSGGGATVSTSYKLFIVPTGGTPTRGHELLLAEKVSNLQITWREPKRLEVSYDKARIYRFFNYWQDRDLDDFRHVVEIRLLHRSRPNCPSSGAVQPARAEGVLVSPGAPPCVYPETAVLRRHVFTDALPHISLSLWDQSVMFA
jgi:hypothetical protein